MAFVVAEHRLSERTARKLLDVDRSSCREPGHNAELREGLSKLVRQKPRDGDRRGHAVNVKPVYHLYLEAGLSVRRKKRELLVRDRAAEPRLLRAKREWAIDFIVDGLATGRVVSILSVVDAFTRECLPLEADTSLTRDA